MNEPERQIMSILGEAVEYQSPEERTAFLEKACAGDAGLRARVEALLRAHEAAGNFLQGDPTPRAPVATADEAAREKAGTVIGPYKLIEPIGEGGMGTVWMAQQQEPVKRLVAVKLIKAGMDSKQVIARFEAERQALALMDHANIARVLDGGTTGTGRPYFVMDLVKGVPITRYCDEHQFTPRQRLELFIPVCQAVQHAHQKGIIHRDLKPSNVLVALYDGKPVPKVIDFGVAKAAGQQLTDKTLVTGFGAIVGTLEYMSPEQAEINQLDIDTRSDIYSLGVLLYELLAGAPPFSRQELEKSGLLEGLRLIREQEPTRPSMKLSTAEGLPTLAANRGTEPAKLTRLVRGELDWIVMKALEKDRNRRYETANGLGRDIERYLHDEPVQACPPSATYRLRKFLRRNKGPALAAAVVLLTFCAGLAGTTWKWLDADYQKGQARLAEADAKQKTRDEQAAREELQQTLYERDIALAYHEWQDGNPGRAAQLLDGCRPEYRGWEWHYLHRLCHSDLLTLAAHGGELSTVAYSPDGRLIAGGTGWYEKQKPGEVVVWDAETGKELFTLHGHTRLVRSVAFSPDSKLLASAGLDPAVRVWDVATRQQVACYPGRGGWMTCVTFNPDGSRLAAADGKWLRVWDVAAGTEVLTVSAPGILHAIAFSPNSQQIAGGCKYPRHVKLWNARTGAEIRTIEGHTSDLQTVAFSPDGKRLASAGWDNKIKVWDLASGKGPVTIDRHSGVVHQVSFSPDGRFVASASWDGTVGLWDSSSGTEVRTFRGHTGLVHSVAFSPDGERLASAGADHQVKVWDVMTEQEGRRLEFPGAHPYGLAFSADGNLLAAADGNIFLVPHKTVAIYDTRTGLRARSLAGHTGRVLSVAFSPRGPQVASGSTDRTVKLWDAATGRLLRTLGGHEGDVTGVAFSSDGRRVASSSADRTVRVWDLETGRECRVLRGHSDVVSGVAFAPDGRIASSSADRTVRLWGAADDTRCLVLNGHTDEVTSVAFRPDGHHLASASADQTLRVWDAADGRQVFVLRGHTKEVRSLAYSPKGDRLVSASKQDNTVRVWDANTGYQVLTLRQSQVQSVAFSPDGRRIASGTGHYSFIQLWNAVPPQPDDPARSVAWFHYYAGQKQWDRAAAALTRVDRQLPGDANLWHTAGQVYHDAGRWDEAADVFARARELDVAGNAWSYHNRIGDCRARQGRRDEAIGYYTEAIRAGSPDAAPWRNRGDCHAALRQWDRAAVDYTEVLNREPDDANLWRERGRCLAEQGKYPEATADFAEACRRGPDDAVSWHYRAVAHLGANDPAGHRRTCAGMLQRFGKVETGWKAGWTGLTAALAPGTANELEPLVRLEEQLVAKEPKNWLYLVALGGLHYRTGRYEEAVDKLTESCVAHQKGGNAFDWLFLAMAHHRLGHDEEARRRLTRSVQWIEKALRENVADTRTPTPLPWNDRVALGALRREAEELILGKPAPEAEKDEKK
jgi:WD40 repeat protein/serine/threonine protein kinase/tetratricopeptide (TPR) repeat protein